MDLVGAAVHVCEFSKEKADKCSFRMHTEFQQPDSLWQTVHSNQAQMYHLYLINRRKLAEFASRNRSSRDTDTRGL
jgi:hypothetical protein